MEHQRRQGLPTAAIQGHGEARVQLSAGSKKENTNGPSETELEAMLAQTEGLLHTLATIRLTPELYASPPTLSA